MSIRLLPCPLLLGLTPILGAQAAPRDARLERLVTLEGEHPWTAPETAEAWTARRAQVRRRVLVAAGLWPEAPRCPLEPVVGAPIEREGYVVESVRFQALPGVFVTGSLYRPKGHGPFPAVLCPHGHWDHGRFTVIDEGEARAQIERAEEARLPNARHHLQARCATLARLGCLVLHYDMIGYADSVQLDHWTGFGDVEAELWGMSHFGLQTLSSIRALDYLESRPDVDRARIAVTGASGGGTQTFILAAVDDRPAVLFPAVMVSTAMQGGCVCENASHLRVGSGNIELAAMAAPRPLGLTGADDWTIEIESKGLPELKRLYARMRAPANVEAWCYPTFPHNYNLVSRTRLYEWLNEHLRLGHVPPIVEPELVPIAPEELSVWDAGHPAPARGSGLERARAAWLRAARADLADTLALARSDPARFEALVGGALATLVAAELPARVEELDGALTPAGAGHRVRWAVRAGGSSAAPVSVLQVLDGEREALACDAALCAEVRPLLAGEAGALPVDGERHARYVGYTWGYNRTLFAERVADVLTAVARLAELGERPVRLVGLGAAAPWTVVAASLAGQAVEAVAVEGGWDFDRITELGDPDLLPRAARYGGIGAFAALVAPRRLLWIGQVPEVVRASFEARGAQAALETLAELDRAELAAWLRR